MRDGHDYPAGTPEGNPAEAASRRLFVLVLALLPSLACVATAQEKRPQPAAGREWARPGELRSKKLIDAGIHTLDSKLNSRWLAEHPEFTTTHPFDGMAVRISLDEQWRKKAGLAEGAYFDDLAWSTQPVPHEAVKAAIDDLLRAKWGQLTDNFLWWNLRGGIKNLRADIESDDDWKAIEQNARLAGRVCREAGLKGLLFDTEQYGSFAGTKSHYPFGKAKPDMLTARGRAWIQAVQREFPDVKIMFTFAWAPDLDSAGFLAGVKHLINGMLDGVEGRGQFIHGYENTFYYGQIAGSRFTKEGFRGDRSRYEEAVASMRQWASHSTNEKKFDRHVRVGMAAWLESDPWNLWSGWPSGTKATIWSNLPLALATSEEYVWCWSEHTNYLHRITDPSPGVTGLNPFLASLTNQTFNTGREPVSKLTEDFTTDPMAKGWHFDFNMLEIGRKRNARDAVPLPTADAVPYRWMPDKKQLLVENSWTRGTDGKITARHDRQRRRFVHPVRETSVANRAEAEFDFVIDRFGADSGNPIMIGLFHSEQAANRSSITLRISGPETATIVVASESGTWESKQLAALKASQTYRFNLVLNGPDKALDARLSDPTSGRVLCELHGAPPAMVKTVRLDEIGIAQPDWITTETAPDKAHSYRVSRIRFERK